MGGEAQGPTGTAAFLWWTRMARDPLRTYGELARRYGEAVRLPFGRQRAFYLLSRPEHVEHVLVSHQDNYVKAFTYMPLRAFLRSGLLTSEGEVWRRHRRLVQPVFAGRHVAAFAPEMVAAATRRVETWEDDAVVDVAAELRAVTLDVVGRALFGADLTADAGRAGRALEVLQHGVLIGSFLPIRSEATMRALFRRLPGSAGAGAHLDRMVDSVIAKRRAAPTPDYPRDLLDLLMAPEQGARLGDAELRDEVMTMLLAGHETTAAALTWTLVLLSRYPAARCRLEAEVHEVLAGRRPEAADAELMPWTRAVISEALRLYPPAWTVERDAVGDDDVAGVRVPAGSTVGVAPYLVHRCADVWPNPEGFSPERFLGAAERSRYAYVPFGGGRRICVGAGFALLEAMLVLATIARTYRLDLVPGVTVSPRAEVTLRPAGPVPMRVRRVRTPSRRSQVSGSLGDDGDHAGRAD